MPASTKWSKVGNLFLTGRQVKRKVSTRPRFKYLTMVRRIRRHLSSGPLILKKGLKHQHSEIDIVYVCFIKKCLSGCLRLDGNIESKSLNNTYLNVIKISVKNGVSIIYLWTKNGEKDLF